MSLLHRTLLALVACLALAGCRQETLYVGLSQTEANEMLSLMYASGLEAEKLLETDGTYAVTTSRDAFPKAMTLLQANGLPREQFESMGKVFAKEGFVSSPLEERARLNFALSQEISRTLSSIDGVVMARVHLVMPERERLAENRRPASASVFVKHRPDVDLSDAVGKIKSIVINGVENLPYDNVTVAFFETRPFAPDEAFEAAPPIAADAGEGGGAVTMSALPTLGPLGLALSVLVGVMLFALSRVVGSARGGRRARGGGGGAPHDG